MNKIEILAPAGSMESLYAAINKGADASQVQNILGHQSVDTTLKCYARVDTNTVKQAHHTYVS